MSTLTANIKSEMALKNWNDYQLAEASGVPQSTIHRILSGKHSDPRSSTVKKLAKGLGVTEAKLLGFDQPYNGKQNDNRLSIMEPPQQPATKVPLINWVSAGVWCEAIDNYSINDAKEWLPCPQTCSSTTYALRVIGDSMTTTIPGAKSYPDGCIIYVDPLQQPVNGKRVIAKLPNSNEATFKTYKEDAGKKWLMPINPQYDKILIDASVIICGVIIAKYEPE